MILTPFGKHSMAVFSFRKSVPEKSARSERCPACPLTACARGSRAAIIRMDCTGDEAQRLRSMGMYEGSCVVVVDHQDGCLLDVCGARLALAARLAGTITVQPLSD